MKAGDKVKFRPTHNKALELTGTIAGLHEDGKTVYVDVDANEKYGMVAHLHVANKNDMTVTEEAPAPEAPQE